MGMVTGDVVAGDERAVCNSDPRRVTCQQVMADFNAGALRVPVDLTKYQPVPVRALQTASQHQLAELPRATQRLVNPDAYPVYMTAALSQLQSDLLSQAVAAD